MYLMLIIATLYPELQYISDVERPYFLIVGPISDVFLDALTRLSSGSRNTHYLLCFKCLVAQNTFWKGFLTFFNEAVNSYGQKSNVAMNTIFPWVPDY